MNLCGSCRKWMKRSCPRERNCSDGYHRGPSMNALACDKFDVDPVIMEIKRKVAQEKAEREQVIRRQEALILTELLRGIIRG